MSLLEVKNVSFTYGIGTPFEKKAVNGVSLNIEKGEFVGIIGHTGSGKSTLIQMLNGLIQPTSGQIVLNGKDIWSDSKKIRDVRFKVGMVFQYPEYQLFEETVEKDIAFGPVNMGLSASEVKSRVVSAAKFVDLKPELLNKSPFELSGGEKRRAAIAGIIAMDPDILILDEPTAGLDPRGRDILLSQIYAYHKEKSNTVLLVSHSMEDISRISDKIVVMNKGSLFAYDEMNKIFKMGDKLEEIGLQIPQITKVMIELRKRGFDVPTDIFTVEQAMMEILKLKKKAVND